MEKVTVRLRDKSSCFYDQKNQIFIAGNEEVEVVKTKKISDGIRYGALVQIDKKENKEKQSAGNSDKDEKNIEDEKIKKAYDLIKSLSEDKPDFEATDYEVLKEWVGTLGLTPASKKKEDYIAALNEAVESFKNDED